MRHLADRNLSVHSNHVLFNCFGVVVSVLRLPMLDDRPDDRVLHIDEHDALRKPRVFRVPSGEHSFTDFGGADGAVTRDAAVDLGVLSWRSRARLPEPN